MLLVVTRLCEWASDQQIVW